MYAVVKTGGKQYRVREGRSVQIERLPGEAGDSIELTEVLLMADGDDVTLGAPTIAGARVIGTIAEQGRAKKVIAFRYKNKTRQRTKRGHRQQFTRLVVDDILGAGQEPKPKQAPVAAAAVEDAPAATGRGRKRAAAPAEPEAAAPATPETAPAETPAEKPKRSRKKAD